MDAKAYFIEKDGKLHREGPQLVQVARFCDVSPYYLFMVSSGHKTASAELAANMEYATNGAVDRRMTLPDFPWDEPTPKPAIATT